MKCPNLLSSMIFSCKADDSPYVPSLFELEEYCKGIEHEKCPLYRDIYQVGSAHYEVHESTAI